MKKLFTIALILIAVLFIAELLGRNDHIRNLSYSARKRFDGFLSELKQLGYTIVIRDSLRTFEEQQYYHNKDKRNATPGTSDHETGNALDIDIYRGGKVLSKKTPKAIWVNTGVPALAKKYGINWGGNFKGYADNNHFYFRS